MKTLKHPSHTYYKDGDHYFSEAIPQDLADYYGFAQQVKVFKTV